MKGWRAPVWSVPVVRAVWVTFRWPRQLPPESELVRADTWWQQQQLKGAVLVVPGTFDSPSITFVPCRNEVLALNVLLRSRGAVLHFDVPLIRDPGLVIGVVIHCDDPRLVALAAQSVRWEER